MEMNLTDEDKIVLKILDDGIEFDQHISAFELINHFKAFEASLTKFDVSSEYVFEKLSIKNKNLENYQMPIIISIENGDDKEEDDIMIKKPCLVEQLP